MSAWASAVRTEARATLTDQTATSVSVPSAMEAHCARRVSEHTVRFSTAACSALFQTDHRTDSVSVCLTGFSLFLPHFNETLGSYLSVSWPQPAQHYLSFMEFEITFLPAAYDGTLLYSEDSDTRDFLSITMVGGHIELRFDCGSGAVIIKCVPL